MLFLVTTDTGFEEILMDELIEYVPSIEFRRVFNGRIIFEAPPLEGLLAALRSRIVNNVFIIIEHVSNVNTLEDIYKIMKRIDYVKLIESN
ncbi:MAG TPA: hypothetical protein ENF93_00800 [Ignisphaera sp.]|nr:hypothetical protein [Ignisphaera sp.]